MSQPSVASFFHSRKRTAIDDIFTTKNKVNAIDPPPSQSDQQSAVVVDNVAAVVVAADAAAAPASSTRSGRRTPVPVQLTAASARPKRCLKPTAAAAIAQPKIVKFTLAGHLSPKKRMQRENGSAAAKRSDVTNVAAALFATKETPNVERGLKTPTKAEQEARCTADKCAAMRSKLSLDEIKTRVTRSARLTDMKASMDKLRALQEQRERIISTRPSTMKTADKHSISDQQTNRAAQMLGRSLKQFDTIDLEILSR